jgi:hypothetical protein
VAAIIAAIRPPHIGRPAALAERLTAQRLRSRAWLAEGLRLTKIHRRLAAQGVRIPYSSLHRFARRQWGLGAATTARVVEPPPGEVAEVDFGRFGLRRRDAGSGLRIPRYPRL